MYVRVRVCVCVCVYGCIGVCVFMCGCMGVWVCVSMKFYVLFGIAPILTFFCYLRLSLSFSVKETPFPNLLMVLARDILSALFSSRHLYLQDPFNLKQLKLYLINSKLRRSNQSKLTNQLIS